MRTIKKLGPILLFTALLFIMVQDQVLAADVGAKVKEGLKQIQAFLTGIVVIVGVCVSIFIIIKKLPGVDDPHTKNDMFRGVGTVLGGVALAAALVWIVPWIYQLFV
ncbi:CagC family type IV secretion system protein [Fictibacillus sp. WQ 8-8]|uniref:CagC family type IV secretion system protein n=1 Tax=unclassified Fictibacillus TaxID=2644029 RepID=UPI00210A194F|nr:MULTISPECIES: CagC family type IV secretion system protein [unclassified Fictibacillus]MCQ6267838.1 CagC family type IV secretion system protein [Fictibacillus sp. WQ 8-8]MED2974186.1 CagC family type IV secretion system protein [Fictibacillus sp. B-59209]